MGRNERGAVCVAVDGAFVRDVTRALDTRDIKDELLSIIKTDGREGMMRLMRDRTIQKDSIRERVMAGGKPCLMSTVITGGEVMTAMKRREIAPGLGWKQGKKKEFSKGEEEVVVGKANTIQEKEPQHKEHESKRKERLVDKANSYNVFGYPLLINGELHYGWFGTFNFDKDAPKDVVFYEFGVKEEDGFTGLAVGHDENHEVRPQLNPSSSEVTLGDLKRIVNGNNEGSEFSVDEGEACCKSR